MLKEQYRSSNLFLCPSNQVEMPDFLNIKEGEPLKAPSTLKFKSLFSERIYNKVIGGNIIDEEEEEIIDDSLAEIDGKDDSDEEILPLDEFLRESSDGTE